MKIVKLELTTYLCYSDETEIIEVELDDAQGEILENFSNGKPIEDEELEEKLPDIYEELDYAGYLRAYDHLVIDGWRNHHQEACDKDIYEIYQESGYCGSYEEWSKAEEVKMKGMELEELAEYLRETYGAYCDMDGGRYYEFRYIPNA